MHPRVRLPGLSAQCRKFLLVLPDIGDGELAWARVIPHEVVRITAANAQADAAGMD